MFGYIGYKILEFIAIATPYPISYCIAAACAMLWFATGVNVGIIKKNISAALGLDPDDKKTHAIAKKIYINWGKNIMDFLKHSIISRERLRQRIEIKGLENLDSALTKGKGVVIFTAHVGNFEWGACRLAVDGYKIWGISLVRKNKLIGKFFESKEHQKV